MGPISNQKRREAGDISVRWLTHKHTTWYMLFLFALCFCCHRPRPKTPSMAYKYVTFMLKDKLVVKTRFSREVRRTQLHWPDSRSQLWHEFMSTFCMGMYTKSQNLCAARRLRIEWNHCGRSRRWNVISSEELVQTAPTQLSSWE